jgi:hypothetical protein
MTEDQQQQLSALLRLKRYEQPPAGYFEKLVQDVHRRQRADMLRRPAWKLALERVQTFLSEHNLGYGSYVGAIAALVILGVAMVAISLPRKEGTTMAAASAASSAGSIARTSPMNLRSDRPTDSVLTLQNSPIRVASAAQVDSPAANARLFPSRIAQAPVSGGQPRYVLDAQPVSYEATTVSFNF